MRLTFLLILAVIAVSGSQCASLRSHLRDFVDLVPRGRVAFLAGRHLLFDASFRAAFTYLRSSNFEVLVRDEISTNPEVRDVISYLGRSVDLNAIPRIIKKVVIRSRPAQEYGRVRTLTSFIQEIVNILPNEKISNLIREKNAADPEFAQLYARIADPQFKALVYRARSSAGLAGAFKTLINNQVDVDQILRTSFQQLDKWRV